MAFIPNSYIDPRLIALHAIQYFESPFPEMSDVYAGFIGNLASSFTNKEVQMPSRDFYVTSGPANVLYDHVVFQENFREEYHNSSVAVDHFTIQSDLFGIFYLTHFREINHDNATICTIRRNLMERHAWIPVQRKFRYRFDYQDWIGTRIEWWLIEIGQPHSIPPNTLSTVFVNGHRYWVKEQNNRYAKKITLPITDYPHHASTSCLFDPNNPSHVSWYNIS